MNTTVKDLRRGLVGRAPTCCRRSQAQRRFGKEFVALEKSQPGKLNYGSVGNAALDLTWNSSRSGGLDLVHSALPGQPEVNTDTQRPDRSGFVVPARRCAGAVGPVESVAVTTSVRSNRAAGISHAAKAAIRSRLDRRGTDRRAGKNATAHIERLRAELSPSCGATTCAKRCSGSTFSHRHRRPRASEPDAAPSRALGQSDPQDRR